MNDQKSAKSAKSAVSKYSTQHDGEVMKLPTTIVC
jgi:hypothetical protein